MTFYRYNALDVAAYFKWASLPREMERTYLDLLFQIREPVLARPLAKDFESFAQAVFREMYHVWARGFENEFSDVNRIAPDDGIALFCDQDFLTLESYMKLISLHLILSDNLPYVRINFTGLQLLLGIEGDFCDYERNIAKAAEMLRLSVKDERGNDFHLSGSIPEEPLFLSIQSDFRKILFGDGGYRIKRGNDYQEKMRILREKSEMERKTGEILRNAAESRKRTGARAALKPDDNPFHPFTGEQNVFFPKRLIGTPEAPGRYEKSEETASPPDSPANHQKSKDNL